MSIEELRKQFIVDEDVLKTRLEPIITKALLHCKIGRTGEVIITNTSLSSKSKVGLTLVARLLGSELDQSIPPDVTVREIFKSTGLPDNQIRARAKELVADKIAVSPAPGTFRALPYKVEGFLDQLQIPIAAVGA
ncbi:MAG TPA: hypothetical protein VMF66_02585 [Candidatus Acidoferrum sp.]|nr:hypothetical protein [Candidatus Acidoferrum sp.]